LLPPGAFGRPKLAAPEHVSQRSWLKSVSRSPLSLTCPRGLLPSPTGEVRSRSSPSTSLPDFPRTRSASGFPPHAACATRGGSAPEARCPTPSRQPSLFLASRLPFGAFDPAGS
jgi:hypothetical protein